ncbi:MAG: alpha/beta fold hydrolase [Herbiconiux sp.]|uniref:alpha/beta fold hydrolase n=1 Tax=Herbiconiux sp. TaxID=1871186 RepID=UPI0012177E19|nr:alpha/beta fold hydrolase [Herbiconiux sp.]TAJ47114.1 MAG: alpha/beta fold hydrolase [Herbiconiux sp.]
MDYATNPDDGTRVAYRVSGDSGSCVVLLHGTALSQATWRGYGYLRELAGHTVVTLDFRGHGRSDKPHTADAYAMARFTGDVIAVLDAAGIESAHLVGYSLGARVGFSLAAQHPSRFSSFTSIAGAPGTGSGVFDRVFFPEAIGTLEAGGMAGFVAAWEERMGHPLDPGTRAAFLTNDGLALAAYMREAERVPRVTDAEIAALSMPVALIAGTRDPERMRAAEHVHGALPTSRLTVVEGAGHADTPRHPETVRAVREFLAEVDAG